MFPFLHLKGRLIVDISFCVYKISNNGKNNSPKKIDGWKLAGDVWCLSTGREFTVEDAPLQGKADTSGEDWAPWEPSSGTALSLSFAHRLVFLLHLPPFFFFFFSIHPPQACNTFVKTKQGRPRISRVRFAYISLGTSGPKHFLFLFQELSR